ncbi:MAG: hypothetical protein H6737_19285 [Alphaproteobacteria bacterium]|nr:hypothetical protein [Alphaproteobacteria bacterium]
MSDSLARILAGLALVGFLINGAWAWRTSSRLTAMQERMGELRDQKATNAKFLEGLAKAPAAKPVVGDAPAPPPRRKAKSKSKGKARLDEEEREERRESRLERRRAKVREALTVEIDAFAADHDLGPELADEVLEEILFLREGSVLVRDDMRDGRMTSVEGRAELKAMRDDSDARLEEILGPELAGALLDRFADEREARRDDGEAQPR